MGNQHHLTPYHHLVVDGSYLLYASIPYKPETDFGPHMPTYTFLKRVTEWVEKLRVDAVTVCWDDGIPERRKQSCPSYKANRKQRSAEQESRRSLVKANSQFLRDHILPHAAIRSASCPGLEADDVIYGMCAIASGRVSILSLDMDLSQLVSDKVSLVRPGKDTITMNSIRGECLDDKYQIFPRTPSDIVLFKALRGDPSDGIKPVIKPKITKHLWSEMINRGVSPSPESIRALANELGISIPPEFDANYTVVDLVRSGVAGDAIAAAIGAMNNRPTYNENDLFTAFSSTGMNPAYLHLPATVLQCLSR